MKIALVNTPAHQVAEAHDLPKYPHLGLSYLAGAAIAVGHKATVIDAKLERLTVADVARRIETDGYDAVGISAMTHDIVTAAKLAEAVKREDKSVPVIVGGVHVTALPSETLTEFGAFDYGVHGEGERPLCELLDALDSDFPVDTISSVAWRSGGNVLVNNRAEYVIDIDSFPSPEFADYPGAAEYHVLTSRGCPYDCVFCMSPYGRDRVRFHAIERVIEDLKSVSTHGPRLIKFNDENLAFKKERAIALMNAIVEAGLHRIPKVASLRVDHVDRDLLTAMKSAGFTYVDYGIESGDAAVLKATKKRITMEQAEAAIRLTKEVGIKVGANYIIGHPGETAKRTIDWAVKLNADVNAFGIMVPYPATEVARMAKAGEGGYRLIASSWDDYNKQIGNALEMETLSRAQMERLQLKGYLSVLTRNLRLFGLLSFVWQNRRAGFSFVKKALGIGT